MSIWICGSSVEECYVTGFWYGEKTIVDFSPSCPKRRSRFPCIERWSWESEEWNIEKFTVFLHPRYTLVSVLRIFLISRSNPLIDNFFMSHRAVIMWSWRWYINSYWIQINLHPYHSIGFSHNQCASIIYPINEVIIRENSSHIKVRLLLAHEHRFFSEWTDKEKRSFFVQGGVVLTIWSTDAIFKLFPMRYFRIFRTRFSSER